MSFRTLSLRELVLAYAVGALLLVLATVAIGGVGLYLWQQSSRESLRINALVEETQGMRGSLYRQMKEVFDALFLDDTDAVTQYRAYAREIEVRLSTLRSVAGTDAERDAIERLGRAYNGIRAHTDGLITDWPSYSLARRRSLLDSELERGSLQSYEAAFSEIERELELQQQALQRRRAVLAWLSPLLLSVPLLGAVGLLLWSRFVLRRAMVDPLYSVQRATEMISRGSLDHRAPEVGAAELKQLARSVNQMARDLSDSRASLVRAEKQATLAALIPVVAHNIRNPLASIRATAQVINDPGLPLEVRDGLQGIISATDRLEHWTHALLSYLNPLEPQRAWCTAGTLADNIAILLQSRLKQRRVRLDLSQLERGLELSVDAQLLEQALHGLVLNAVEATPEGGAVALGAARIGGVVQITIEDHAGGMPFTPDPQDLRPGPSTKRFGTGLGIPFAVKVCDVHGGSVRFEPLGPNGTRVLMTLPA